jgi:hypothetical protein
MALGTISVKAGFTQSNDQRTQSFWGGLQVSAPTDTYPVGGFPLDSVLLAALQPTSNTGLIGFQCSGAGAGYIYQRIPSTGKLMVLQIPPNGSLTTAAPLQQLPSSANSLTGVWADNISFEAVYLRNS